MCVVAAPLFFAVPLFMQYRILKLQKYTKSERQNKDYFTLFYNVIFLFNNLSPKF